MKHNIISTQNAPSAIGPYSQAVAAGDLVFVSGQIPLDPATGAMVEGGIEAQTERAMANLGAVLEAAGLGFGNVVKTTIFLTDMGDFPAVNAIYGRSFSSDPPARATIQVAALPKGALIEIEVIAARG
ncbi:MAG: RidA family protein [Verrucomicrobia bacterium]|nr:RidA family protein [Verrucomicrobiota bacterium]